MGRRVSSRRRISYSVPIDAPLYQRSSLTKTAPLTFPYVTDADAAAKLLPDQFELTPGLDGDKGELAYAKSCSRSGVQHHGA